MLNIALPTGRLGDRAYSVLRDAGYGCGDVFGDNRKLIFKNEEQGISYFLVKPVDVPIYVEYGIADIGVAGKDILIEHSPDVYELLDLGIGRCRMAVAAKNGYKEDNNRTLRVATKFVNAAKAFYRGKSREIEIIKLSGSIETAPLLELSDVIVDIVETGTTLKENGLSVIEEIFPISARLIANKSSYNFKSVIINEAVEKLKGEIKK
ncbi:MAG: ATP phosphoribosyltransferase [Eubacteriales bacterium]|nr:ATP phosphoribosyltransferase [Eubacteriales bacterium]